MDTSPQSGSDDSNDKKMHSPNNDIHPQRQVHPPDDNDFPLNGWFERDGFSPVAVCLIALVTVFVLYQLIGGILTLVAVLIPKIIAGENIMTYLKHFQIRDEDVWIWRVMQGLVQVVFLLLPVFFLTRFQTGEPLFSQANRRYLGMKRGTPWGFIAVGAVGIIALNPVLSFVTDAQLIFLTEVVGIDAEVIRTLREASRMPIEKLAVAHSVGDFLFSVAIVAVTPAICEEVLFRGFVQRNFSRILHPQTAAILAGIIFGVYHLNLVEIIPLIGLGVYMGFLRYYSGSIYPSMVAHFTNNFFSVALLSISKNSEYWGLSEDMSELLTTLEPDISSPFVIMSFVLSLALSIVVVLYLRTSSTQFHPR